MSAISAAATAVPTSAGTDAPPTAASAPVTISVG